jgi:hypothetical protein
MKSAFYIFTICYLLMTIGALISTADVMSCYLNHIPISRMGWACTKISLSILIFLSFCGMITTTLLITTEHDDFLLNKKNLNELIKKEGIIKYITRQKSVLEEPINNSITSLN